MSVLAKKKNPEQQISDVKKVSWKVDFYKNKYIYLMLVPVVLYYIIFHYIPMGGLLMAFQDFKVTKGFLGSDFVGFQNFIDYLTGPYAVRTISNTIIINIYALVIGFPAPIIFALLLNEIGNKYFKSTVQTISYMPHFISAVVVAGLVVDFVSSQGVVTNILMFFGFEQVNILSKAEYFRLLYTFTNMWKTVGWGTIIYLATLSNADPTLYEAATIDGAGRFKQLIHITFPVLIPIVAIQLILRIGNLLSEGYEMVLLLYSPIIYDTADIISTYVYRMGIENRDYSFAAAVGMFNSVVNLALLTFANWFSRKFVQESLW